MTNEMIMMKSRKATNAALATQVQELRSNRSFLDILRETCARDGGRYTLRVESGSADYTVLVDRGGPFNAVGGGSAGIQALVSASQLRSGRCTIIIGWPVDQPLFQPGLDVAMKTLVGGVVQPQVLPRHRGVESLRNSDWSAARAVKPAPSISTPPQAPAAAPISAPPREPAKPAPVLAPAPSLEPKMAWKPVGSASAWLPVSQPDAPPPAAAPGRGAANRFATQALLWLVQCDDPSEYSLEQAATMARRSFGASISQVVHPFRQDFDDTVSKIKDDWEKSGAVAAKAKRKRRGKRTPVNVDADREFRLH